MTEEEVKEHFERWSKLYKIRCERAFSLYECDAPDVIVNKSIDLIREALEYIRVFGRPYNEAINRLPLIQGHEMIKEVFEAEQREQFEKEDEANWARLENNLLKELAPGDSKDPSVQLKKLTVSQAVQAIREKGAIIIDYR